jgi:predicted nicotinamide N-methyase
VTDIATCTATHRVGGRDFVLRALSDGQQYDDDPSGAAERAGISSAQWSLFGTLWPAGLALAVEMVHYPVAGKRILEVGCGLGLASLVLHGRGADVTASDYHPEAAAFLAHNVALNGFGPLPFRAVPWAGPNPDLGAFDLVIGSDVLYERGHATLLSGFLGRHALADAAVVITDPGRGQRGAFRTAMRGQGYTVVDRRADFGEGARQGHVLTCTRNAAEAGASGGDRR